MSGRCKFNSLEPHCPILQPVANYCLNLCIYEFQWNRIISSVPRPHFKYSTATCGSWLPYWTAQIKNVPITVENSIRQCWSGGLRQVTYKSHAFWMECKLLDSKGYIASTYNSAWHTKCPTKYLMTGLANELVNVTAVTCHSLGMWTQCSQYCCSPERSQKSRF